MGSVANTIQPANQNARSAFPSFRQWDIANNRPEDPRTPVAAAKVQAAYRALAR